MNTNLFLYILYKKNDKHFLFNVFFYTVYFHIFKNSPWYSYAQQGVSNKVHLISEWQTYLSYKTERCLTAEIASNLYLCGSKC